MSEAKDAILGRIRLAVTGAPELPYRNIARMYHQTSVADASARLGLFESRLRDYGSVVYCCSQTGVSETIALALSNARKRSLLMPSGFPSNWIPAGHAFRPDENLSYADMDAAEGVITTCAVAIAETGTIVLRHSEQEGRRALTLIPDYHLCIVEANQIVGSVVEAIRLAALFGTAPITTISGPSATSDIEMIRVKGVHGPRTLDVVIIS